MIAGSLEVQLLADVARIKADMDKAVGHITSGAKAMNVAAAGVKAALGGIVAGLSVAAFAGWIRGAIDAADAASKLAQQTGLAVKDVAGMQLAYKLAGLEGAALSTSISRLSKSLVDNNKGLEALGVKTKAAGGAMRSTKAVLYDVADQIAKMPDGLQKTAIAVEIFSRTGADMIPLLNGGSQGLREMEAMAQKLGLTLDESTARQAEQFNDTLDLIGMGSQGVANSIMAQLLPTLTSLAGSFLESMTSGDKLANTAAVLGSGLKLLYTIGVGVVEVFSTVGKTIGAAAGQIIAILQGDFAGARRIGEEWARDMSSSWSDTAKAIGRAWSDEGNAAVTAAATVMGAQKDLLAAAKAREEAAKKAAAEAKKAADAFAALAGKLNGKESGVDADFLKNLKLLATEGKKAGLPLAEIIRLQELYIAQQPYMTKAAKERQAEFAVTAETTKELADAEVAESQARERARVAVNAYAKGIGDTHEQLKLELSLVGATEAARKRALALYKIELDLKQQIAAIEDFKSGFNEAQREEERAKARAAAAQARADVELQAEIDVADKAQKEWETTNKQIGESFVDNLMKGGKSVAQYLKDLFRTLVLRPLLAPVGNAMAGMVGTMPTNAAGAGGSGLLGMAGNLTGLNAGIGSAIGGSLMAGFSGASAALAGGSTFGITGAIGGYSAAMGVGGTGMAGAAGSLMAGGSAALAAIPVAGWIALAALAIASLAGGGETRSGGKYTGTGFLEGPSGGEINGDASRTAIGATMGGINSMLASLGSTATLQEMQSGFEQSENGKGFAYAGGTLSTGAGFGQTHGAGWQNRRGSMTAEQAAAAFGEELKQATLQALQAADVPGQLGDYLRSLGDIDALSGGALDAALARINKALTEKQNLEEQLYVLTHTELEVLNRNREREREALDESNRALYDQVIALQDQRIATDAAKQAHEELASVLAGTLDDATRALADARRAEADGLKTTITNLESAAARYRSFGADLRRFRDSLLLGDLSPLTPGQKYAEARRIAEETYARALTGDQTAMGQIQSVAQEFLRASQVYNASGSAYLRDFAMVQDYLLVGAGKADEAAAWAQAQAAIANAQLSALGTINQSVLTVAQAIADLRGAGGAVLGAGGSVGDAPLREYLGALYDQGRYMEGIEALGAAGRTMAQGDALLGFGAGTIEQWAQSNGVPVFHGGNAALLARIESLEQTLVKHGNALIAATRESSDRNADRIVAGTADAGGRQGWERHLEPTLS